MDFGAEEFRRSLQDGIRDVHARLRRVEENIKEQGFQMEKIFGVSNGNGMHISPWSLLETQRQIVEESLKKFRFVAANLGKDMATVSTMMSKEDNGRIYLRDLKKWMDLQLTSIAEMQTATVQEHIQSAATKIREDLGSYWTDKMRDEMGRIRSELKDHQQLKQLNHFRGVITDDEISKITSKVTEAVERKLVSMKAEDKRSEEDARRKEEDERRRRKKEESDETNPISDEESDKAHHVTPEQKVVQLEVLVKSLEAQKVALQLEVETSLARADRAEKEVKRLEGMVDPLRSRVEQAEKDRVAATDKLVQLTAQLSEVLQKLNNQEDRLRAALTLEEKAQTLVEKLVASLGQRDKLELNLAEATAERYKLAEQVRRLDADLRNKEKELADTRHFVEGHRERAHVVQLLVKTQDAVEALTKERDDLKAQVEQCRRETAAMDSQITRLLGDTELLKAERETVNTRANFLEEKQTSMWRQLDSDRADIQAKDTHIKSLEEQRTVLQRDLAARTETVALLEKETRELQEQVGKLDADRSELQATTALQADQLANLDIAIKSKDETIGRIDKELAALKEKLAPPRGSKDKKPATPQRAGSSPRTSPRGRK